MKELTYLLLIVIAYFVYMNFVRKTLYLESVKSDTGPSYLVRNLKDKQEAANRLGDLSETLQTLCDSCKGDKGGKDQEGKGSKDNKDKDTYDREAAVKRLLDKFEPEKLTENIPGSSHVAYSVNKGSELSICLRKKGTNAFIDTNTVRFVAIHELAHVMSKSTGHTDEFWDNMKFLLEKAMSAGLYVATDYKERPVDYCGIQITSTPLDL
jgi:hypothetical protein